MITDKDFEYLGRSLDLIDTIADAVDEITTVDFIKNPGGVMGLKRNISIELIECSSVAVILRHSSHDEVRQFGYWLGQLAKYVARLHEQKTRFRERRKIVHQLTKISQKLMSFNEKIFKRLGEGESVCHTN